jgi:predicted DNA-binding antitoxin AbrB/MazE fold protein
MIRRRLVTVTTEAIYENGVLRPLKPLEGLKEHSRVTVTVTEGDMPHPLADLAGTLPREDAEEMMRAIEAEFERIDPDEWK